MAGTNGTLLGVYNGPTVYQAFSGQQNFPDVPGPPTPEVWIIFKSSFQAAP